MGGILDLSLLLIVSKDMKGGPGMRVIFQALQWDKK